MPVVLIYLVFYVGIGIFVHLLTIGSYIDPSSAITWLTILFWPVVASLWLLAAIVTIVAVVSLVYWLYNTFKRGAVAAEPVETSAFANEEDLRPHGRRRPASGPLIEVEPATKSAIHDPKRD